MTLSKICLRLCPSAYLSINLGIKWIISRIPRGISKIIFVQVSYESLAILDGKTRQGPFSMIQYCKITVWYLNGPCAVHVIHFAADYHISLRTPKATLELQ